MLAVGSRRLQSALSGSVRALETWTGAALRAALDVEEKEELSIALYDEAFNPDNDFPGLYPWENTWLARRLPPPPARLLVGAAGSGREAVALEGLGYTVIALEPSKRAAAHCERQLQGESTVIRGSYRELIAVVLDGVSSRLTLTPSDRFDAIVLGWGSFGHVLRERDRFRLLKACAILCPDGPILLSVFLPPARGRSEPSTDPDLAFLSYGGFLTVPTAEELARHARALGRELIASLESSSPYFTLVANSAKSTALTDVAARETER
jgi:SAM-dependent methyltransferase